MLIQNLERRAGTGEAGRYAMRAAMRDAMRDAISDVVRGFRRTASLIEARETYSFSVKFH